MKEVRISDAQLQQIIGRPLVEHLRRNGFQTGRGTHEQCSIAMPIELDLAGAVDIIRSEDGIWTFRQELDYALSARMEFAADSHMTAIESREAPSCR